MVTTRYSLPGILLRLEGLAAFAISILLYARHDASWLLLIVLALAPDLSAIGYLGGPRLGTTPTSCRSSSEPLAYSATAT